SCPSLHSRLQVSAAAARVSREESVHHVEGMELLTSSELEAVNGTDVRLKCTFKSTHPLSEERVSVSWIYNTIFLLTLSLYYSFLSLKKTKKTIPTSFQWGHAVWSGDIMKGDASITLQNVQLRFNGTYSCQVKNPPDIQGFVGEISLRVIEKGKNRCCAA
uniref:Myelin protein zero-like 2b n=1 Tax=Sinocyclocheilus rhinocerous TaxID=307959 RepID=A0A673G0Y5_9TELE